jgi:hypothetical protein
MLNDEPISVNADRPVISERCIKVTRLNCKYGQAVNLARRERDYYKTFGANNVRFRFFAATPHHSIIENLVGQRLIAYRMRGTSGRLNEWLQGISAQEVEAIVKEVVASLNQSPEGQTPLARTQGKQAQELQEPLGASPRALVAAALYLEENGMSVELLRNMHHSPLRRETFKSAQRYFSDKRDLQLNNQLYGARLMYVAEEHKRERRPFEQLAEEALQRHPK